MPRPIHFEIQADIIERAVVFYRGVFDWTIQKWEGPLDYWLVRTGDAGAPGIDGGLMPRMFGKGGEDATAFVCTMDVPDLDAYLARVTEHGGQIAVPKMAVPGVGYMAYCRDTENNIFGLMQEDPTAA